MSGEDDDVQKYRYFSNSNTINMMIEFLINI
jgi:hypothetical protein